MTSYKLNNEKNGVELYFNACPSEETRNTLKSNGWRWSKFGGCWYNKQTPENIQLAQSFANGEEIKTEKKPDFKDLINDYAARKWGDNAHMMEYIKKSTCAAFTLENGDIVGVDKPRIKTHFCFHDEGPDYDFYKELHADKEKMRRYFMNENLKSYDEEIEQAEKNDGFYFGFWHGSDKTAQISPLRYCRISNRGTINEGLKEHELVPDWTPATEEERKKALEILKLVRADFEKRLVTWWKRYGVEHLKTWTYWADA